MSPAVVIIKASGHPSRLVDTNDTETELSRTTDAAKFTTTSPAVGQFIRQRRLGQIHMKCDVGICY